MLDVGSGPPLVLIPGIQGRWEWMLPAIDALAGRWRVVASSLPGEPGVPGAANGPADFEGFVPHVDAVLDAAGIERAVLCGVSFGGMIAVRYAARRADRVRGLILVSTPGPRWTIKPEHRRYMRWPTLSSPLFFSSSLGRFWPELCVTYPDLRARLAFCAATLSRVVRAPAAPRRMSHRASLADGEDFVRDCADIKAPTLVIAGEPDLDRVVRQDDTMSYESLIHGARAQRFEGTGHLGVISAPGRFAAMVGTFPDA